MIVNKLNEIYFTYYVIWQSPELLIGLIIFSHFINLYNLWWYFVGYIFLIIDSRADFWMFVVLFICAMNRVGFYIVKLSAFLYPQK